MKMKQLNYILLSLFFFIVSAQHIEALPKTKVNNTQLCFNNTPPNFGTTHFIVGYNESSSAKATADTPKGVKKRHSSHKKQQDCNDVSCLDKTRTTQSFFTTIHDLSPILLEVMSDAKRCLHIAAFSLTDIRIVDCLKNAHKNGIDVCVITDASNMKQAHNKVQILVNADIPVWYYKPSLNPQYKKSGLSEPFMHHKLVVGDDFVVTGSANFTKAGQKTNIENITVVRDKQTVDEYHAEFERLKKYCVRCTQHTLE
jgi:phosphatidylserine/phosphatidylglycerophosphate/cardiolipin synthase-like enzyme